MATTRTITTGTTTTPGTTRASIQGPSTTTTTTATTDTTAITDTTTTTTTTMAGITAATTVTATATTDSQTYIYQTLERGCWKSQRDCEGQQQKQASTSPMLPLTPLPPDQRTLPDEEPHDTSIRLPRAAQSIQLSKIAQEAQATRSPNYSNRLSRERYSASRNALPSGNFDWTEHGSRVAQRREKGQWSWRQRALLALVVVALAAGVTALAVFLLSPAETSLHEESVQPTVPTFYEMSGKITAPKLHPLVQLEEGHAQAGEGSTSARHRLTAN